MSNPKKQTVYSLKDWKKKQKPAVDQSAQLQKTITLQKPDRFIFEFKRGGDDDKLP